MLSAKSMAEVSDSHVTSKEIEVLESIIHKEAEKGKYFVKLWSGTTKVPVNDAQLLFIEQYDAETYNLLTRLGYLVLAMSVSLGEREVELYIGWGFDGMSAFQTAVRSSKE